MKEKIRTFITRFIDYKLDEHRCVILVLVSDLPKTLQDYDKSIYDFEQPEDENIEFEINVSNSYCIYDSLDTVVRCIRIGVAICHPDDKFDRAIGEKIALEKARLSKPILYVPKRGYIGIKLIDGLIEQEANYLETHPEKYIKGYIDSKIKFDKKQRDFELLRQSTELHRQVAKEMLIDPNFMRKVELCIDQG